MSNTKSITYIFFLSMFGLFYTSQLKSQQFIRIDSFNILYLDYAVYGIKLEKGYTALSDGMYLFNHKIPVDYVKTTTAIYLPDSVPHDGLWFCRYDSGQAVAAFARYENHHLRYESLIELFPSGILSSYSFQKDTLEVHPTQFELLKNGMPNSVSTKDRNGTLVDLNWDDDGRLLAISIKSEKRKGRLILFDQTGRITQIKKINKRDIPKTHPSNTFQSKTDKKSKNATIRSKI